MRSPVYSFLISGTIPSKVKPINSSISSGLLTRSSKTSTTTMRTTMRPAPAIKPRRTLRRIFGEEGDWGTSASSKVVTSDTLVTEMIFSAATFRRPLAMRAASFGSPSLAVIERIRVSVGTDTLIFSTTQLVSYRVSILRWLGSRHFEKEWFHGSP